MELPEEVLRLFPADVSERLNRESNCLRSRVEEIRCRCGQPFRICYDQIERSIADRAVTPNDLDYIFERACNYSYHARRGELSSGFLHTAGGLRIGICGTITDSGIHSVCSLAIRIPHEIIGCSEPVIPQLLKGGFQSAILLSPPGTGKTTLLRDLIRALSRRGYRISVADERGEIAAVSSRAPQFQLGPCTDVMTGGKKADTCMMLLRAMNPQIIAVDEITALEDAEAIQYITGCGVSFLATAHAESVSDLQRRPIYREMLHNGIFRRAVQISMDNGMRNYRVVDL